MIKVRSTPPLVGSLMLITSEYVPDGGGRSTYADNPSYNANLDIPFSQ